MKKLLIMFVFLFGAQMASAQTDTTSVRKSGKLTEKEKASMKSADRNKQGTTDQKNGTVTPKEQRSKRQPETTQKKERTNGTTGVQEFPDTEGAGTGTGNDSRVSPPPGEPEKLEK